ncbi:hypothetical protein [Bacillus sp. 1P06AnD]|uniref:hypothetical protein n=1 Tax=Bacillus sp. 1P06AnD TaxID=3132208 RepID=UPI00399FAEDB
MKKIIVLAMLFGMLGTYPYLAAQAKTTGVEEMNMYADVTGNAVKDHIILRGSPLKKSDSTYKKMSLKILYGKKTFQVPIGEGKAPRLLVEDITNDGIKDVIMTMKSLDQPESYEGNVFSFKKGKWIQVELPEPVMTEAYFKNQYAAEIVAGKQLFKIDLNRKKEEYERLGIYRKGLLNEPMELLVGGISMLKPVYGTYGTGFMATQKVSGISEGDPVGELNALWVLKNGKWKLQRLDFSDGMNRG